MEAQTGDTVIATINGSHNVQPNLIAAEVITFTAAILGVFLRFWSRRLIKANFGWDDWLIALAAFVCTGRFITAWLFLSLGGGRDIGDVTPSKIRKLAANLFATEIFYATILFLARASALVLWPRIFVGRRIWLYCVAWRIINIMWVIAFIVVICTQCIPLSAFFDVLSPNYKMHCHESAKAFWLGFAASGIIIDVAIISLPMTICARLRLNRTMKAALIALIATGLLAVVCSSIRLHYVRLLTFGSSASKSESLNFTWEYGYLAIWSDVEMYVSVVATCLPCLKPVFVKAISAFRVFKNSQTSPTCEDSPSQDQLKEATMSDSMSSKAEGEDIYKPDRFNNTSSGEKRPLEDEESTREDFWYGSAPGKVQIQTGTSRQQPPQTGILVEEEFRVHTGRSDGFLDMERQSF